MNTAEKTVMGEQGGNGTPGEMRRAATRQSGSPVSQSHLPCTENFNEPVRNFQAEKLRRLYSFCHATARTVATLAFAVSR